MAATDKRRRDPEPSALERLLERVPLDGPVASEAEGSRRKEHPPLIRDVPVLVLISLVVAILIKSFLVQAFFIPSSSMEPTLMPGDRVLVSKLAYRFGDVGRGDV
ncbi:MAG: signal peptidase I, partial [Acidimicrobiales bacterium]